MTQALISIQNWVDQLTMILLKNSIKISKDSQVRRFIYALFLKWYTELKKKKDVSEDMSLEPLTESF